MSLAAFGRLVYRHRRLVLVIWAALALLAVPLTPRVFRVLQGDGFTSGELEAARADAILAQRFAVDPASLLVVYEDPRGQLLATDPRFQADVATSLAGLTSLADVADVALPADHPRQIAPDERAAYAVVTVRPGVTDTGPLVAAVEQALQPTELQPTLTGEPVFAQDINDVTERDLRRAELISFPFAAVALVLVFGSPIAALLPVLGGGVAVAVTLAAIVGVTLVAPLSIFALNLTTLLGLALGIDYALVIISRFREELNSGRAASVEDAVARALATAGRAVLFSGTTVAVGLLGLLLFEFNALWSLGIAGVLVVSVSLLAALTLLPALLSQLGGRVDALSPASFVGKRRTHTSASGSGAWARLARAVMAHPWRTALPVVAVLVGLGLPFAGVKFGAPDASILPASVQSRAGFDILRAHWGEGEVAPLELVFQTRDGGSALRPDQVEALYDFLQRVQADPSVARVESIVTLDSRLTRAQYALLYGGPPAQILDGYAQAAAQQSVRGDVVVARVVSRYGQTDDRSKQLVRAIRTTPPPEGFTLLVGGGTAGVLDYVDTLYQEFPRAAGFVVVAMYMVLLITFRSVLLPLKALVMTTLSILASYGALVVVFQDGALSGVLRFAPLGFVEASLPIVLFCILFGLSMDYEVFLLSRVLEARDAARADDGGKPDVISYVAEGLERSGPVITSAAAIVVLVSLSFVAADIVLIKALGLGTAIAVLLDATLVRSLLVPAILRLLGDWNWWAPSWVRRLPWEKAAPHRPQLRE